MRKMKTLFKRQFENHYIEGIVFYRGNGEMCKIKFSSSI